MNRALSVLSLLMVLAFGAACSSSWTAPSPVCATDVVCVNATVRFFSFEGGFWAVRGDDDVTYDPVHGVPSDFQREGLRVHLVARHLRDVGSFHMAGPIVEILSIRAIR